MLSNFLKVTQVNWGLNPGLRNPCFFYFPIHAPGLFPHQLREIQSVLAEKDDLVKGRNYFKCLLVFLSGGMCISEMGQLRPPVSASRPQRRTSPLSHWRRDGSPSVNLRKGRRNSMSVIPR